MRAYYQAHRESGTCLKRGEQAKVRLCKLINRETNLLLLDEPTNHLDVDAKEELNARFRNTKVPY